jgi:hypothetical protein
MHSVRVLKEEMQTNPQQKYAGKCKEMACSGDMESNRQKEMACSGDMESNTLQCGKARHMNGKVQKTEAKKHLMGGQGNIWLPRNGGHLKAQANKAGEAGFFAPVSFRAGSFDCKTTRVRAEGKTSMYEFFQGEPHVPVVK